MTISQRPRLNKLLRLDGLPNVHGDYFRPADRIIESLYHEGILGDLVSEILYAPSILSGLLVSINVNTTLIDVTAGTALGYDSQVTSIKEHNYTGAELTGVDPITTKTFPISSGNSELDPIARFIKIPANLTAISTAGIPNSSNGFVKLRFRDASA